jgi:hypothetical protein
MTSRFFPVQFREPASSAAAVVLKKFGTHVHSKKEVGWLGSQLSDWVLNVTVHELETAEQGILHGNVVHTAKVLEHIGPAVHDVFAALYTVLRLENHSRIFLEQRKNIASQRTSVSRDGKSKKSGETFSGAIVAICSAALEPMEMAVTWQATISRACLKQADGIRMSQTQNRRRTMTFRISCAATFQLYEFVTVAFVRP